MQENGGVHSVGSSIHSCMALRMEICEGDGTTAACIRAGAFTEHHAGVTNPKRSLAGPRDVQAQRRCCLAIGATRPTFRPRKHQ